MTTTVVTKCPVCQKRESESPDLACKACQIDLRQEWETPPEFMRWVDAIWAPGVDACASVDDWLDGRETNSKCNIHIDPILNALGQPWCHPYKDATFYCNPPYANVRPWIDKAIEAAHDGGTVVMLLPAQLATSANGDKLPWFGYALEHAAECHLLWPRIKFIPPKYIKASSPSGSNALFVFRRSPLDIQRAAGERVQCPIFYTNWTQIVKAEGV